MRVLGDFSANALRLSRLCGAIAVKDVFAVLLFVVKSYLIQCFI
jgi:hypothetical protein